jgi:hypothetical protein
MTKPLDTHRVSLKKQGVGHTVALPLTFTSILRQKKNYGNSKYFTMQKYNLQKML